MKNKCLCGCDNEVNEGKKWLSGHNRKGNKISDEVKNKISIELKGKSPWNKGIKKEDSISLKQQGEKLKYLRNDPNSIYNSNEYKRKHLISMNTDEVKRKLSLSRRGRSSPSKGIKMTLKQALKNKISAMLTIDEIKEKYPLFSKLEEIRFLEEIGERQVRCSYCEKWFTPTIYKFRDRINAIEKLGSDINRFYCSEDCKELCPIYRKIKFQDNHPTKSNTLYTQEEYQTFRKFSLERDNYICQFCGEKATDVHHEKPQKLEPFFSLDLDYAWSCCKKCHYSKGHKDNCSTGKLANIICF